MHRHRTDAAPASGAPCTRAPAPAQPRAGDDVSFHRPRPARAAAARALLRALGAATLVAAFGGCEPARSNDAGNDTMILGLFKPKKLPSTVAPELGAALVAEKAFPATAVAKAAGAVRDLGVTDAPPAGRLAPTASDDLPGEAFVADGAAGAPGLAVVNLYAPKRTASVWELDARDPTRFGKAFGARFDAQQSSWIMFDAESVVALPARRLLIHVNHTGANGATANTLHVFDAAGDRMRSLGEITPDFSKGVPLQFIDTLQAGPQAVLVLFHSDKERLGQERYVNHYDHLVLFSPRHPDGLEIVKLGLDDGAVRRWGLAGTKLWLQTADDRASPARTFTWSIDLGRIL